ncbi:zinc finger protein DZIP1 [Nylanderia fulva]|uniref:zinc finger protein DZIP1 n=1 Tax=Nylanderia fulva TaxID=613905 RepID=UPI0010FBAF4F|nr:zinc finger protein DZIP1 [Nylanderia fulva]XP_029155526.1 zinc finger protein DZIP1 [Nylanderia fulva]
MAFSFRAGTNWCHDFPKLARESGFYFNMHGSRVRVDWNRISAIDIDRLIRERDFSTIDENINNVIDYSLESEYDVKILDSNFVKLFRLAQLSVEYLLYCKQYLDHSVIILKDELRQKIEQNVSMKKEIATLEDTIKSLKDRSKEKRKLIEANVGEISNGEIFKCPHCPKTFVRAIFVNAHIARKHSYTSDMSIAASPVHEHYRVETEKLHNEIKTLKERLNQTERVIRNESDKLLDNTEKDYTKNMSKNEYDISKLDRLQEQRRYQEDIGSLKNMLFDEIRALREKDHVVNENILETNIKTLISQQEKEIDSLRNQLLERLTPGMENMQVKLQTQENYWKAKIEDMETQHRRDIERLTTELKVTQQIADHVKSEYTSKVHDLEKQSMDQSNMLVEQRKQLNSLSLEISNSQTQNICRTREKNMIEEFHKSPLLKTKRDSNYIDAETHCKSSNNIGNTDIIIEDIGSESSQEYRTKPISITSQSNYVLNKNNSIKSKDNKRLSTDLSRIADHTVKSNLKSTERAEVVRKLKNKAKHDTLNDVNKIIDCTSKSFTTKQNIPVNVNKKYLDITNIEKERTLHSNDMRNNKKSEFLGKHSVSSMTESESSSLMSESRSSSESMITDDDITVRKYETSTVKSLNIRKMSIQEDAQTMLDNRLRDLGIDPEWQGIPAATFKQKMEIIKHQQNINAKRLLRYNQIKQKILEDVLQRISANHKESKCSTPAKNSPLNKPVTQVKSKAWKAFSNHKDSDEYTSVQKTENTTPSKLHLKQKIELLPKRYKDNETYENTREPLTKNGADVYTSSKVISTNPKLIRNYSSVSSIESPQEDIKQISSTKITVSDTSARKISSPIGRKQIPLKFLSNNDSDSTVIQQDDSILSPKNSKSVLKPMSGSVGSLVKKKVLFDLDDRKEDTTMPENDQRKSSNDWNISSSPEREEYELQKEKSMSTSNIVLKTSQSDKIAEISKKIQEQLSIARKPPAGSVETIFRSNMNLQDLTNYNTENHLLKSISLSSSISNNPVLNVTSPKTKDILPQPAPRTLKDKDFTVAQHKSELKYSDLDSDIDEILQMG